MGNKALQFETIRQHGFTLIELMVTCAIAGILLAVGIPSFSKLISNNRIATQTNEFVGALGMARGEAVRRGDGVSIRSTAGDLDYAGGWKIFTDAAMTGSAPASSAVIRESSGFAGRTTLKRVTRSGSAGSYTYANATSASDRMYLSFNSRGANNAGTALFFKVCDSTDSGIKGRILQVSSMGKVSLDSSSVSCP
jgi:type IV fimbrial biogenesis protein FimT